MIPKRLWVNSYRSDRYPDLRTYMIMGEWENGSHVVYGETDNDPEAAQLFATAPELLAALEALIDHNDGLGGITACARLGASCPHVEQARAAIARARGGAA